MDAVVMVAVPDAIVRVTVELLVMAVPPPMVRLPATVVFPVDASTEKFAVPVPSPL
jgi:hypothetical protein